MKLAGNSDSLSLTTPERVRMGLTVAGLGHRVLAYSLDVLFLFFAVTVLYFGSSLVVSDFLGVFESLSSSALTWLALGSFAALWVYWTATEALFNGRTLGKRIVHIRVVKTDGSPIGLLDSAVRNLLRWLDFLPALYGVGVLTMLISEQHRRVGDLVAGTLVIHDAAVDLGHYQTLEPNPSTATGLSEKLAITAEEQELVSRFLHRAPHLSQEARASLTRTFFERFTSALPPEDKIQWQSSAEEFLRRLCAR